MKNKGALIFGIVGWCLATYGFIKNHNSETTITQLTQFVQTTNDLVKDSLPKLSEKIERGNIAMHKQYIKDTSKRSLLPPTSIIGKMDTVERALLKQAKVEFALERNRYKDSLNFFRKELVSLSSSLKLAQERFKDIRISTVNPRFVTTKSTDADLSFYEFSSQRKPGSLFSPNRNYLRIINNADSGRVNQQLFYDYELANDQIYQLMFQLRTAYTLGANRKSIGFGVELKLNNVSINGVINYQNMDKFATRAFQALDPEYKQNRFPVSFGVRYDFAKIVFR